MAARTIVDTPRRVAEVTPAPFRRTGAPRRRGRWRRARRQMLLHLVLVPLILLWVYPFLWMLFSGFKTQREMLLGGLSVIPDDFTWENYPRAWSAANFGQYTLNTVVVSASVVAVVILISSMAGYALGRGRMPGKRVVVGLLVATMFLPKGFTIIPVFLLIDSLGLNNSLGGIVLAESGPAHVIAILLFMGYFGAVPTELEEAATIDGAGFLRTYWQVMMPLAKPVIATVAIFNFIGSWNAFLVPLVFTLATPELRTLGVGMYAFFGEFATDWTGLAAASIIAVAPVIAVFLWLQRYFVEGIAGAIKG